jgi:RNA polymerase-binding transcription factor DksA
MTSRLFSEFAEASAFAKQVAKDQKIVVRILRRADQFIVEGDFAAEPPTSKPPASKLQPRYSTALPQKQKVAIKPHAQAASDLDDVRLCIDCGVVIPPERVHTIPSVARCVRCQSALEQNRDTRAYIDEGLAGTREGHKRMRGQLWGDMRNRARGNCGT